MPDLGVSFTTRVRQIEVAVPSGTGTVAKLDDAELADRLAREHALLNVAQPHLAVLSALVSEGPHVLCVADAQGYVMHVQGDSVLGARLGVSAKHACWQLPSAMLEALTRGEPLTLQAAGDASRGVWTAAPVRSSQGNLIAIVGLYAAEEHQEARDLPLVAYVASNIERTLAEIAYADEQPQLMRELDQNKNQLRELDQRLELILDNAPVYIYVVDENNRFLARQSSLAASRRR